MPSKDRVQVQVKHPLVGVFSRVLSPLGWRADDLGISSRAANVSCPFGSELWQLGKHLRTLGTAWRCQQVGLRLQSNRRDAQLAREQGWQPMPPETMEIIHKWGKKTVAHEVAIMTGGMPV